jgi:ATP-dependent RNA helicase DHX29
MAKKKKSQLKPVARGFATTSVPKKVVENEQKPDDTASPVVEDTPRSGSSQSSLVAQVQSDAPKDNSFDPDNVEEQSLQNLVDKYQEKTEKETLRTIKVTDYVYYCDTVLTYIFIKALEVDRRFSKTLPSLQVDSVLVDRILKLNSEVPDCELASVSRHRTQPLNIPYRREKTAGRTGRESSNTTWNLVWSSEKAGLFGGQSG